ncbi:MAG: DUF975 family protein [Muribaculaceae bacterium]|nr:DUF975 family protein [Muribaculaceae bacterium]
MNTTHTAMMEKARNALSGNWLNAVVATLIYMVIVGAASTTYVLELIIAGPMLFGLVLYFMCLADTHVNNLELLFKGFNRFVETLVAGLIYTLAVSIGTALLIVPGVIAACGLGMTFFIMADDPNISGIDALKLSWNMMNGHKWEFFCLNFRFILWILLASLTCGIGFLWLIPYMLITQLYFYRQLRYGTF